MKVIKYIGVSAGVVLLSAILFWYISAQTISSAQAAVWMTNTVDSGIDIDEDVSDFTDAEGNHLFTYVKFDKGTGARSLNVGSSEDGLVWAVTEVDNVADGNIYNFSLSIGSSGNDLLSYVKYDSGTGVRSLNVGSSVDGLVWAVTEVDSVANGGISIRSLSIGSSGNDLLSYVKYDSGTGAQSLNVGSSVDGLVWPVTEVASVENGDIYNFSLSIGSSGNDLLSYLKYDSGTGVRSLNVGSSEDGLVWAVTEVDSVADGDIYDFSLSIGSSGNDLLSYVKYDSGTGAQSLNVGSSDDGSVWAVTEVASVENGNINNFSLSIGSSGNDLLLYVKYDYGTGVRSLNVGSSEDGLVWAVTEVDSMVDGEIYNVSLSIGSSGNDLLSYVKYDSGTGARSLNVGSSVDGLVWAVTEVDSVADGNIYNFPLSIGSSGNDLLSYVKYDSGTGVRSLNVGSSVDGLVWPVTEVDSLVDGNIYNFPLSIGSSGNDLLSYVKYDSGTGVRSLNVGSSVDGLVWPVTEVASVENGDIYNFSLSIGSSGNDLLSYLKYDSGTGVRSLNVGSSEDGLVWAVTEVDSVVDGQIYDPSLSIGSSGNDLLSYVKYDSGTRVGSSNVGFSVDGSVWAVTEVDSVVDGEIYNVSLSIGSSGNDLLSYLKYDYVVEISYLKVAVYADDTTAPEISLTEITPDPTSDTTPTLRGVATENGETLTSVAYQIDSTDGAWVECGAKDGTFDSKTEQFVCSVTTDLSYGEHTMYVKASNSGGLTTDHGDEASETFFVNPFLQGWRLSEIYAIAGGGSSSIAVDGDGNYAIAFYSYYNGYYTREFDNSAAVVISPGGAQQAIESQIGTSWDLYSQLNGYSAPAIPGDSLVPDPMVAGEGNVGDELSYGLLLAKSEDGGDTWYVSAIDDSGNVGDHPSLFIDDSETYLVSYFDGDAETLKYAKSDDGGDSWTVGAVTSDMISGYGSEIVEDGSGDYVISYYGENTSAVADSGVVSGIPGNQNILGETEVLDDILIGIDPSPSAPGALYIVKSADGGETWERIVVDMSCDFDLQGGMVATDLQVVGEDDYILSYQCLGLIGSGELRTARSMNGGDSWELGTVDNEGDTGHFLSGAISADGDYAVSYVTQDWDTDSTTLYVAYTSDMGDSWDYSEAYLGDTLHPVFGSTSMAIDGSGKFLVTYTIEDQEEGLYRLMYGISSDGGATWTSMQVDQVEVESEPVDDGGAVKMLMAEVGLISSQVNIAFLPTFYPSTAIDQDGNILMSYYVPGLGESETSDVVLPLPVPGVEKMDTSIMLAAVLGGNCNGTACLKFAKLVTDYEAPTVELSWSSSSYTTDNTPGFMGTATDIVGAISSVEYQIDGTAGTWIPCTADNGNWGDESQEVFTCTVAPALADGSYTIYVRATDRNGNTTASGNEVSRKFTVDTILPEFPLEQIGVVGGVDEGDKVMVNIQRPTFRGATEPYAHVTITIHSDPIVGETDADEKGSWSWTPSEDIPVGTHRVVIVSRDLAGNETSGELTLTVLTSLAETGTGLTWFMVMFGVFMGAGACLMRRKMLA